MYFADTIDMPIDAIAGNDRTDALRRPGEDQIAGLQAVEPRQIGDDLGNAPDKLAQVRLLPHLAVHAHRQRATHQHFAARRSDLGHDRGFFDVFAEVPWTALIAGGELQVAARHVEAARVTVDKLGRI